MDQLWEIFIPIKLRYFSFHLITFTGTILVPIEQYDEKEFGAKLTVQPSTYLVELQVVTTANASTMPTHFNLFWVDSAAL